MTNIDEVLTAASAALVPALRRGNRGRRVDRVSLGLDEGPLDRGLVTAARERGLAIFVCTDSARMVNVVSLAGPTERDLHRALKMLRSRPRSAACSLCGLQSIVPATRKSPFVPMAGTFHRVHPECLPAWRLWVAAAEKQLAARAPSPIPATEGLAAAVIRVAPQLLGNERGWRGRVDLLWHSARAVGGAGAWSGEGFGASSFGHQLRSPAVRDELAAAGLLGWVGADGLARLARIADTPASHMAHAASCGLCGISELDGGEALEQLPGGVRVHRECEFWRGYHSRRRAA